MGIAVIVSIINIVTTILIRMNGTVVIQEKTLKTNMVTNVIFL